MDSVTATYGPESDERGDGAEPMPQGDANERDAAAQETYDKGTCVVG